MNILTTDLRPVMDKRLTLILIAATPIVLLILSSGGSERAEPAFHITLASPDMYTGGTYADKFTAEQGEYYFRFVPNGSSPETLSIVMNGKSLEFSENYILEGTLQQTVFSEYYTWEYAGHGTFVVSEVQDISITINPNGNVMGAVSVDILKR